MNINQLDFLKNYQKGIYKMWFSGQINRGILESYDQQILEHQLIGISQTPKGSFISTPDEFFYRWQNTRLGNFDKGLPHYVNCSGFDLGMPYIRMNESQKSVTGRLDTIVIASDLSYGDHYSRLVFVVNDIKSEKVVVYKEDDELKDKNLLGEKRLLSQTISSLGLEGESEKYPFESEAPGKAASYCWSLINISPDEVYNSLKKIGFIW
jgi:hypothetical protein